MMKHDNSRRRSLRLIAGTSIALLTSTFGKMSKGATVPGKDALTPLSQALATLQDGQATPEQKAASGAIFTPHNVSLTVSGGTLKDAFLQLFAKAEAHLTVRVDVNLDVPVGLALADVSFATAVATLLRLARRNGQPVVLRIDDVDASTIVVGTTTTGTPNATPTQSASSTGPEEWPIFLEDARLQFNKKISRATLNYYLSRAVTHLGLCASTPDQPSAYFEDDLRMLKNIGARFIQTAAYAWTAPDDDEAFWRMAQERTARVHQVIPEAIVQGGIPETAYEGIGRIPVPEWVFKEFGLPVETRNFHYEAMLYADGKYKDHWVPGGSVPDMSKRETRMYFYYRARRYIDCGFEALNFAQVQLMAENDAGHLHWAELLRRIRSYATRSARRQLVLCTAHTYGIVLAGNRLLFDYHAWPMRTREVPDAPGKGQLTANYQDAIYGQSVGGITPSGWDCDHAPYAVEIDNWGRWNGSDKTRAARPPFPWVWGDDEISWFAHQSEAERNEWLHYAWHWVKDRHEDGWMQMPTRRVLADAVDGVGMYHANTKSGACPTGFSQEATIKAIWS